MPVSAPRALLASLTSGSISSLVGLGGGFILTPLLVSKTAIVKGGMVQRRAQATVLASIGVGSGFAAASYIYFKGTSSYATSGTTSSPSTSSILSSPTVQTIVQDASLITLSALCCSPIGVRVSRNLDNAMLKRLMGWTMIVVGPTVPLRKHIEELFDPNRSSPEPSPPSLQPKSNLSTYLPPLMIGSLSGLLAGLLGVGGGAITVPLISLYHSNTPNYQYTDALATSLLAMPAPAIVASIAQRDLIHPTLAITLAVGSSFGGASMARMVESVSKENRRTMEDVLRWGFCGLMLVLGKRFIK